MSNQYQSTRRSNIQKALVCRPRRQAAVCRGDARLYEHGEVQATPGQGPHAAGAVFGAVMLAAGLSLHSQIAGAAQWNKCGCSLDYTTECSCSADFRISPWATHTYRARCEWFGNNGFGGPGKTGDNYPNFIYQGRGGKWDGILAGSSATLSGTDKDTTCTPIGDSWNRATFIDMYTHAKQCTNWSFTKKDSVTLTIRCWRRRTEGEGDAVDIDGLEISMLGAHGKYVVAEPDGQMNANRTAIGPWEKFTLITHADGTVSLRSSHDKYVVAESDGSLNANRTAIGTWEKFTRINNSDGTVSFRSHHGKYLVAEPDGRMNANRTAIGRWEKFQLSTDF